MKIGDKGPASIKPNLGGDPSTVEICSRKTGIEADGFKKLIMKKLAFNLLYIYD